jgi:hypothetical protein
MLSRVFYSILIQNSDKFGKHEMIESHICQNSIFIRIHLHTPTSNYDYYALLKCDLELRLVSRTGLLMS